MLVRDILLIEVWRNLWKEKLLPPPREHDTDVPATCIDVDTNAPKTKRGTERPNQRDIHRKESLL